MGRRARLLEGLHQNASRYCRITQGTALSRKVQGSPRKIQRQSKSTAIFTVGPSLSYRCIVVNSIMVSRTVHLNGFMDGSSMEVEVEVTPFDITLNESLVISQGTLMISVTKSSIFHVSGLRTLYSTVKLHLPSINRYIQSLHTHHHNLKASLNLDSEPLVEIFLFEAGLFSICSPSFFLLPSSSSSQTLFEKTCPRFAKSFPDTLLSSQFTFPYPLSYIHPVHPSHYFLCQQSVSFDSYPSTINIVKDQRSKTRH